MSKLNNNNLSYSSLSYLGTRMESEKRAKYNNIINRSILYWFRMYILCILVHSSSLFVDHFQIVHVQSVREIPWCIKRYTKHISSILFSHTLTSYMHTWMQIQYDSITNANHQDLEGKYLFEIIFPVCLVQYK